MEVVQEARLHGAGLEAPQGQEVQAMTAGHDIHGLRHHDPLCPPGIKPDHESCLTCMLLRKARAEERGKVLAVAETLRRLLEMPL